MAELVIIGAITKMAWRQAGCLLPFKPTANALMETLRAGPIPYWLDVETSNLSHTYNVRNP